MTNLHLIELNRVPILEQLRLEEALLRTDARNFCIINRNAPRAIVLGCSGIPHELIDLDRARSEQIPIIQRFSGGGCVLVDEDTLFCSFICSKELIDVSPFPEPILRWGADLYQKAWNVTGFDLREQDYAIFDRKCGGNAQYIQKDRWLLHTSFLWDFQQKNMEFLHVPKKRPAYRKDRSHGEFLCCLKEYVPSQQRLIDGIKTHLSQEFHLHCSEEDHFPLCQRPHRTSTTVLNNS